jgi:nickel transport protein
MKYAIAYALVLLLAGPAAAHSVWLQPDKDGKLVVENGHPGEASDPYDPSRITNAYAVDTNGNPVAATVIAGDNSASVSTAAPAALVAALFDNKYWAKGKDGKWNNGPKGTVADPTIAGPSYKMPKTYLTTSSVFGKPFGLDLEIIPLADPVSLKAGDKLTVQVLLKGRPLPDADVVEDIYVDHDTKPRKLKTDKDGKVTVTVPKRKFAGIELSHFAKDAGSDVEGTFYNASITFPVKH